MINWNDVPDREGYKNLLIGNGFSINICHDFSYNTLLDEARRLTQRGTINIYPDTFELFDSLNTTNFEEILKVYYHAYLVHKFNKPPIKTAYKKLQEGLFSTIQLKHVERDKTPTVLIFEELKQYGKIFTTNYDLIPYWSFFDNGLESLKDFFWGEGQRVTFDRNNTEIFRGDFTQLFYLHGALHLEVTNFGKVRKRRIQDTLDDELEMMRDSFNINSGVYPLFITEGLTEHKLRKIKGNDYLSFCFSNFKKINGNLLIYGHSLNEEYDNHIVEAIMKNPNIENVAISIYPNLPQERITEIEGIINRQLSGKRVIFFNSQTHPLGLELR